MKIDLQVIKVLLEATHASIEKGDGKELLFLCEAKRQINQLLER